MQEKDKIPICRDICPLEIAGLQSAVRLLTLTGQISTPAQLSSIDRPGLVAFKTPTGQGWAGQISHCKTLTDMDGVCVAALASTVVRESDNVLFESSN